MPTCQECNSSVSVETCPDINYLETLCDPAFIQPIKCTYWSGAPISCLGIETSDTGEEVIQKIATALCAIEDPVTWANYVKISSADTTGGYLQTKLLAGTNVTITKQNTGANETLTVNASFTETALALSNTDNTLLITPNVSNNHAVLLGIKLSTDAGNSITKTSTGLYVPNQSFKVKTTIDDTTEEFLLAKLVAGSNITLTKTVTSGVERISIAATASSGLSSVSVQSTDSILLAGNGTSGTPITATLQLSSNVNNIASFDDTDGSLLVLQTDNFAKVSAQDTTTSYLENKIVAGTGITRTKLNGTSNESLQFSLDTSYNGFIKNQNTAQSSSTFYVTGLGRVGSLRSDGDTFLSPTTTVGSYDLLLHNISTGRVEKITPEDFIDDYSIVYTSSNGITKTGVNFKLGGTLVNDTLIDGETNSKSFILTSKYFQLGGTSDVTTSSYFGSSIITALNNTTASSSSLGTILSNSFATNLDLRSFTLTNAAVSSNNNTLNILLSDSKNLTSSNISSALSAQINLFQNNTSTTSTLANLAAIHVKGVTYSQTVGLIVPTITNSYAIYIEDNLSGLTVTNKYGIYQAGSTLQNYFAGVTTFASGAFDSDMRFKTLIENAPIVNNIGLLKSKSYTKDGQFHIGYFAQEVQEIIPSAVITKNDGYLSVAYHEVHTAKIEYLENRIQELENVLRINNLI